MNSEPLSLRMTLGRPSCSHNRSSTRVTCRPLNPVETSMHRHSRVQSSITLNIRNFRPLPKLSVIKSSTSGDWDGYTAAARHAAQRCVCDAVYVASAAAPRGIGDTRASHSPARQGAAASQPTDIPSRHAAGSVTFFPAHARALARPSSSPPPAASTGDSRRASGSAPAHR